MEAIPKDFAQVLAAGNQALRKGEWLAHIHTPPTELAPATPGSLVKILHPASQSGITYQEYETSQSGKILHPQHHGSWPLNTIPFKYKRVQVIATSSPQSENAEPSQEHVRAFLFNPVQQPAHFPMTPVTLPITSPHGEGCYKTISRNYRRHDRTPPPKLASWKSTQHPAFKWNTVIRSIYHLRFLPRIRALLYKILTHRVSLGPRAHAHLSRTNQLPHVCEAHAKCLLYLLPHASPCSAQHLFWECSTVQPLWHKVRRIYLAMNLTMPITSWDTLPELLLDLNHPSSRACLKTLNGIVTTELFCITLYAIWCEHCEAIRVHETCTDPSAPDPALAQATLREFYTLQHTSSPSSRALCLIRRFNSLLASAIHQLPFHAAAISNDNAFEFGLDIAKQGPLTRQQNLTPRLSLDYSALTPSQVILYRRYWARDDIVASVQNSSLRLHLADMDTTFEFMQSR